jgi:hypothetical protein
MTVTVGVIGTGSIGSDHVRRLSAQVSGARVGAVFDVDTARADAVAAAVGARAHADALDVIDDPAVEAVVIASPGDTHAALALACLTAGKPPGTWPTRSWCCWSPGPAWSSRSRCASSAGTATTCGARSSGAGPNAWDRYTATAVAEAGVGSLMSGRDTTVALAERPALYA